MDGWISWVVGRVMQETDGAVGGIFWGVQSCRAGIPNKAETDCMTDSEMLVWGMDWVGGDGPSLAHMERSR